MLLLFLDLEIVILKDLIRINMIAQTDFNNFLDASDGKKILWTKNDLTNQ